MLVLKGILGIRISYSLTDESSVSVALPTLSMLRLDKGWVAVTVLPILYDRVEKGGSRLQDAIEQIEIS